RSKDLSYALNTREDQSLPTRRRRVELTPSRRVQKAAEKPPAVRPNNPWKKASRDLVSVDGFEPAYIVPIENTVVFGRANRLRTPSVRPVLDVDILSPGLEPMRRIAVGISIDEQPLREGGWRPF